MNAVNLVRLGKKVVSDQDYRKHLEESETDLKEVLYSPKIRPSPSVVASKKDIQTNKDLHDLNIEKDFEEKEVSPDI